MDDEEPLSIWTVYRNPSDQRPGFYARRFEIFPGNARPTRDLVYGDTLDQLRNQIPEGLACLARHPSDDPVVVEVWL